MGKNLVTFVLDETGSMGPVRDATISGFNEYLAGLKEQEGADVVFTLVQFNSGKLETVHDGVPVVDVPGLNALTYRPTAMTPLYDAVMTAISRTAEAAAEAGDGATVLLVIMTDGEENASKQYRREDVFAEVEKRKAEGWTVAFLGANQDAWAVGASIGVPGGSVMAYDADDPQAAFRTTRVATKGYLAGGGAQSADFFSDADRDDAK